MRFKNRREAGRLLGEELARYKDLGDALVLGLPRGGVPVAGEAAKALGAPLDVFVARKLGAPGHEELAMGAIAAGGVRALNEDVIRGLGVTPEMVARVAAQEERELKRRESAYRRGRSGLDVRGRTVILVDDGLATGATMRAAALALRIMRPARIIVAVPVASVEACRQLERDADEVICLATPDPFYGVGAWYDDFEQTTDDEVLQALAQAEAPRAPQPTTEQG